MDVKGKNVHTIENLIPTPNIENPKIPLYYTFYRDEVELLKMEE